ncbi:MAG: translation initiation inhibitor [Candidatus Hydrogenedentes bacterium]|nr:translation initiation inhibitor [Candidatus Hydrogenedentota bacterium]
MTAPMIAGEHPRALFERAAGALHDRRAAIVSMEIAGIPYGPELLGQILGPIKWPVTWIDRHPTSAMAGVRIWAIAGPTPSPIHRDGTVAAVRFEDPWAVYCRAGGLLPEDAAAAPANQATSVLNAMVAALRGAGMEFSDVARTWFFNRDITAWYDAFNRARNVFFDAHGMSQCHIPASTGVGGGDVGGAALTAGLLAVRPRDARVRIDAVDSPMQCAATNYGSAFSRAIELAFPDHARVLVSGTASIAPRGQTEHAGDAAAQTDRTIDVVGALLASRDMSWDDVTDGIAYVKRADDVGAVAERFVRKRLEGLPIMFVHADICRDDLLFELEVNAVSPRPCGVR